MNLGLIVLAFVLVAGTGFAVIAIAGAQQPTYVDSFGNAPTASTNLTQSNITATAAPLTQFGGGIVFVIGFFIVVVAGLFLMGALKSGTYGQSRR